MGGGVEMPTFFRRDLGCGENGLITDGDQLE